MFNPNTQQKKNLRKWIKALRSGKFTQGEDFLESNGKHCCLGVACRTIPEIFVKAKVETDNTTRFFFNDSIFDQSRCIVPRSIMEDFFGIGIDNIPNAVADLTNYNDGRGHEKSDFIEISNMLEDYLIACRVLNS